MLSFHKVIEQKYQVKQEFNNPSKSNFLFFLLTQKDWNIYHFFYLKFNETYRQNYIHLMSDYLTFYNC